MKRQTHHSVFVQLNDMLLRKEEVLDFSQLLRGIRLHCNLHLLVPVCLRNGSTSWFFCYFAQKGDAVQLCGSKWSIWHCSWYFQVVKMM
jgi:hypothetical protein